MYTYIDIDIDIDIYRHRGQEERRRAGGGSGLGVGSHGPRTVTSGVAPRVALCADRDGFVMPRVTL
jgi:hypothetical protein